MVTVTYFPVIIGISPYEPKHRSDSYDFYLPIKEVSTHSVLYVGQGMNNHFVVFIRVLSVLILSLPNVYNKTFKTGYVVPFFSFILNT